MGMEVVGIEFSFYGAATVIKGCAKAYKDMFLCVLAGPASGIIFCVLFYAGYLITGIEVFVYLVSMSAVLNLMNLLPVPITDGGRILDAIISPLQNGSRRGVMIVGNLIVVFILFSYTHSYLLSGLLLILGVITSSEGIKREEMAVQTREYVMAKKKMEEEFIFEEKQKELPSESRIEDCQKRIIDADNTLLEIIVPRKMNRHETIVCCFYFLAVASVLLAFYLWSGASYLKLFA